MLYKSMELLSGGYSQDKKYRVTSADGTAYFLRVSPAESYENRKFEFEVMESAYKRGVSMCEPIEITLREDGVHTLASWISGDGAEIVIPKSNASAQYAFGVSAGENLRLIHSVDCADCPAQTCDSYERHERRLEEKLHEINEDGIQFNESADFIAYLKSKRELLSRRPQTLLHNDYHIGNMIIGGNKLYVIDFGDIGFGDPYGDFSNSVWSSQYYPDFTSGQIDGYFGANPPDEFWKLLAYYTAAHFPTYISWAKIFGRDEINKRIMQAAGYIKSIQNSDLPVPSWYRKRNGTHA